MVEAKKYLETHSEKIQKKKEGKLALSAILTLVIATGLAAGVSSFIEGEIEKVTKKLYYSDVYHKADKDTNNYIDYGEAYNLGIKLNVIKETNICSLTSFDEIFNKASLKNVTNYLNKK